MIFLRHDWRAFLLTTIAVVAMAPQFLCAQVDLPGKSCSPKFHQHFVSINGYIFKTYQELTLKNESACLEVLHAGKVVFREVEEGGEFILGQKAQLKYNVPGIPHGTDVTGRDHPNMIAFYYSGGAHCCTSVLLFELEPKFRLISTLDTGDNDAAHFERNMEDGTYYFITWDEPFAYWHACYLCSPMPKLILKPVSDTKGNLVFQLDLKKMLIHAPTEQEWQQDFIPKAREAFAPDAPFEKYYTGPQLWEPMLNLIYGGQADWAWKLVDAVWPAKKSGKEEFLGEFCGQLTQSEYWPDLKQQLGNPPASCLNGIAAAHAKGEAQ
jgi:hypothetical protein